MANITVFFPGSIDSTDNKKNNAINILRNITKYKTAIFLGNYFNIVKNTFNNFIYDKNTKIVPTSYFDNTKFKLEYNSTVTLYEHEYICKLKEDEFNFTSNQTIRLNKDVN